MNVLIVGYGVVGHNLEKEIEKLENQHFDEITKAGLKNGN